VKKKTFAVDIDGTITENGGGRIHLDALEALRRLTDMGHNVIYVTGRSSIEAFLLAVYGGTTKIAVGENGGCITLDTNDHFRAKIELDINGLSAEEVGVEILFARKYDTEVTSIVHKQELEVSVDGDITTYECDIPIYRDGVHDYVFRVFPKSNLIDHPNEFPLVKWI
jgi:hydroxymethylpyrimidine pyrophosphatase-like HAD family hydrolase